MPDRIAFDIKLMRPGCVLIQAGMGGDPAAANRFDSRLWLTDITPDMAVYDLVGDQLERLVRKVEEHHR